MLSAASWYLKEKKFPAVSTVYRKHRVPVHTGETQETQHTQEKYGKHSTYRTHSNT
jgi:hypothetical protein